VQNYVLVIFESSQFFFGGWNLALVNLCYVISICLCNEHFALYKLTIVL
jgi:hypothetical protein